MEVIQDNFSRDSFCFRNETRLQMQFVGMKGCSRDGSGLKEPLEGLNSSIQTIPCMHTVRLEPSAYLIHRFDWANCLVRQVKRRLTVLRHFKGGVGGETLTRASSFLPKEFAETLLTGSRAPWTFNAESIVDCFFFYPSRYSKSFVSVYWRVYSLPVRFDRIL